MPAKRPLVLKTLYSPDEAGQGPTDLDLVLVHGLQGHEIGSFTDKSTGVCWPRDLLPEAQPRTRVLSFGYNGDVYENTSVAGIRGNANSLLLRLRDARKGVDPGRPCVILGHSLGGLVVKQALLSATQDPQFRSLGRAIRGLLFFGVPHGGGYKEQWVTMAHSFAPLTKRGLSSLISTPKIVKLLVTHAAGLADLSEDFRHIADRYSIATFYETEALPGTKRPVVDRGGCQLGLPHETFIPLSRTHMDLCHFPTADDDFLGLSLRIQEAAGRTQRNHGPKTRVNMEDAGSRPENGFADGQGPAVPRARREQERTVPYSQPMLEYPNAPDVGLWQNKQGVEYIVYEA